RKPELARELAGFFLESARHDGGSARLGLAGESFWPASAEEEVAFTANASVLFEQPSACLALLKSRGMRIVISDFLTSHAADATLRLLSANSAQLAAIMLLGPWESEPTEENGVETLTDAETGASLPIHISASCRLRYLQRLERIRSSLREVCIRTGGLFVEVRANVSLIDALKRDFLACGLLKPIDS
ncbi:MAG: hypothetical protein GY862_30060, partial [Gammaproteobacteria bacterium]|nr:hypothetical protein [Gammaproteobacteria bacterium]